MNITKETEQYVFDNQYITNNLRTGLINYSKLARKIINDTKITPKYFNAVLVALRRLEEKLNKKKKYESSIINLLRETKLTINSKIIVCIIEKGNKNSFIRNHTHMIHGAQASTIITSEENLPEIKKIYKNYIIKIKKDLIEVILKSPQILEDTPGVMGHLYSLFAMKNINIIETMSCWTDTIFVLDKKDMQKAVELLSF